ncbi:MAG: porin [Proteobacteria bacterium]|nr:porin [Pseudomonadota bacterium]
MSGWRVKSGSSFTVVLILAGTLLYPGWMKQGSATAAQMDETDISHKELVNTTSRKTAEYHTPLAGEPLHTVFMGKALDIPARDRGHVTALVLGGEFYTPKQGNTAGTPIGALYLKRMWEESRTRDVISIFVNDLEYDRSFGNLELVARFDNNTLPGGQREVVNNKEIKSSDAEWGTVIGSLGPGLRYKVAPFQVDNDLRLQLLGKIGYFYAKRTNDTGPNLVLPPDTMLYGVKLRGRYDGMRRNLLELPHTGMAAGFDLDYMYRDKWANFGTIPDAIFTRANTRSYLQFNGYFMGVGGIPGLSEKNRMLFSFHGGITPDKSADRYNAITIGGGPLPGESDDLSRPDYPGTMFNQVLVSDYALAVLQYRREIAPFLYLHLRETLIWADRAAVTNTNKFLFKSSTGAATTIGVDAGFFWDSSLYLGYSWDSSFIRNGKSGSALIITWSKSF